MNRRPSGRLWRPPPTSSLRTITPTGNVEPCELAALIRLGVPRESAQQMIEAAAQWTMSALASEDSVADTFLRERLFHDGLNLLLLGMQSELESRTAY